MSIGRSGSSLRNPRLVTVMAALALRLASLARRNTAGSGSAQKMSTRQQPSLTMSTCVCIRTRDRGSVLTAEEIKQRQITSGTYKLPKPKFESGFIPPHMREIMATSSYQQMQERRRLFARQFRGCTLKERLELKHWAVETGGGCCRLCGYQKCMSALEFHHLEPHKKQFSISAAISHIRFQGIEDCKRELAAEIAKCVLLCANCHREVESGYAVIGVQHGS